MSRLFPNLSRMTQNKDNTDKLVLISTDPPCPLYVNVTTCKILEVCTTTSIATLWKLVLFYFDLARERERDFNI